MRHLKIFDEKGLGQFYIIPKALVRHRLSEKQVSRVHPDYQRNPPAEGQEDYRRTLYWNPNLQLDANGQAHITFFNNSQTTQICVEANGQAADGTLLYSGAQTKR